LKPLIRSFHAVKDGTAYFVRAVSYIHKMFIKSTTGVELIKLFFFVTDEEVKKARVFVRGRLSKARNLPSRRLPER
jgi:hypothetical protein